MRSSLHEVKARGPAIDAAAESDVIALSPLAQTPDAAVEALLDRAFGADRHARTAYRIRGGSRSIPHLSFAAHDGDALVGTIQCWPIALAGDDGRAHPLAMVGPVAVEPARQRDGLGKLLMAQTLSAAADTGDDSAMMLIGDPDYYGRFFGFTAAATALWRVPGPVERHRLLARGPGVPAVAGMLGERVPAAA